MNGRGIVGLVAAVAVLASGCTSDVDAADELRDIREVLAEAPEEADAEPDAGAESAPPDEGPAAEHEEAASAEAPEPDEELPGASDVDVTVVPEEITDEYVQAVLDELERIYAEALVLMMEEGELTIEVSDRVGEIFATRQLDLRRGEFVDAADEGFPGMRPSEEIETRRRIVQDILDQSEGCLYVETLTNDQAFFSDPVDPVEVFVLLEFPTAERPVDINPTPWVYGSIGSGEREAMRELQPCEG